MFQAPSYLESRRGDVRFATAAHTPSFHTRDQDEFIVIYDGDRTLATLSRDSLYFDWREWYPDGRNGVSDEIRRPYHNPSIRGTTIVNNWRLDGRQAVCSASNRITFGEQGGSTLSIRIDEEFGADESGFHELVVSYDPAWGCYMLEYTAELAMLKPYGIEFSNIWSRGAGEFWPADVDLHHVIWQHPDGLRNFPHNPLVPNLPGNMDQEGQRRIAVGGFLGLGVRHRSNPVIEILGSHTRNLSSSTCSCWYDEHIWMNNPTPLEADGRYHWRAHYRIFSIPEPLAASLLQESRMIDMGDTDEAYESWRYLNNIRGAGRQVQPFQSLALIGGEVSDFSKPIAPTQVLVGNYWYVHPQPYGTVTWDKAESAILLTGRDARAELTSTSCGPSLMMHDGCNYRFRADVKTESLSGAAWLQGSAFLFSPPDATSSVASTQLSGTTAWTTIELLIHNSQETDYMLIGLHLRGTGKAWFRNILLEEITQE